MKKLVARGFILFFAMILLSSCGFLIDESQWDEGHGELSNIIGDVDVSYDDLFIPDYSDFVDFNPVEEDVDYGEKTGEWFDGQDLGYGIPAGTMVAGDGYEIVLMGHDPDGGSSNRDMRVELHKARQDDALR